MWSLISKSLVVASIVIGLIACQSKAPAPVNVERQQALLNPEQYASLRDQAASTVFAVDPDSEQLIYTGQSLQITLDSFYFNPDTLLLQAGTIVRLELYNPSATTHYFGGDAFFRLGAEILEIHAEIQSRNIKHYPVPAFSRTEIYLFVKDPGEYPLDCYVPVHRQQGMTGTIIVQ